jgi:hypothetical protein
MLHYIIDYCIVWIYVCIYACEFVWYILYIILFLIVNFAVLGVELRALFMLGKWLYHLCNAPNPFVHILFLKWSLINFA